MYLAFYAFVIFLKLVTNLELDLLNYYFFKPSYVSYHSQNKSLEPFSCILLTADTYAKADLDKIYKLPFRNSGKFYYLCV